MNRFWLISCLALFFAVGTAHPGAWTAKRGRIYFSATANYFTADEEFDEDGDETPFEINGEFRDVNLTFYTEWGLRDNLTLFSSIPLKAIRYEQSLLFFGQRFSDSGRTTGLGDFELGARVRLVEAPVVVSFQGLVKVPGWFKGEPRLPLSNEQYDAEARLLMGQSLFGGRAYYGLETAHRFRKDEPSDEWRYLVELGGTISRHTYARVKYDGIESRENVDDLLDVFGNPLLEFEAERTRLELTAGVRLSPAWATELMWATIPTGRNTAAGDTLSAAIIYRRR